MILSKYAAALLSIALVVVTAFVAIPDGALSLGAVLQLAVLAVAAVGTYLVPVASVRWRGLMKTGVAIVGAALVAVVPFVTTGTITATGIAIVVLAGLNALAVEVGVQIRADAPIIEGGEIIR